MPSGNDQQHHCVDELSSRLSDGLKCCHSLVSNYRALLASAGPAPRAADDQFGDPQTSRNRVSEDALSD